MSFIHLAANERVDPRPHGLAHQEGVHRLAARRQLIHHGDVQVAVEDQGERPGNGRGRHDEQVRISGLGRQRRALGDAEAMLLVGNDKIERCERHVSGEQRVGPDDDLRSSVGDGRLG